MARRRVTRYSRRTGGQEKSSRIPLIILCAVIFLTLCVAVSVVIGILLGQRADEQESRPKFEFNKVEYQSGQKTVKSIEGYYFAKGSSAADYYMQGIYDFSFCLRHRDGTLDHANTVANAMGLDSQDAYSSLSSVVRAIQDEGGRACGYFYVSAFKLQNEELRSVHKAYELALISEMAKSGVDEILLLGITVTDENVSEVEEFLALAASGAQKTAIGVAVSYEALMLTENQEKYHASRLKNACDFLAVDLTELTIDDTAEGTGEDGTRLPSRLEEIITDAEYYIDTYKIRLVFSSEHSQIYRSATALGIVDFQIVSK